MLSHGRGRADGFSGPPAGAAPRNDGLLDSSAGATLFVLLMYSLRTLRLHVLCLRLCAHETNQAKWSKSKLRLCVAGALLPTLFLLWSKLASVRY